MTEKWKVFTDGACSGNPGPAGIGVVIYRGRERVSEISKGIGEATNNIAEYTALIYALQQLLILRADNIDIFTDSELMYRQVLGQYKVKNAAIQMLYGQVQHLLSGFKALKLHHVRREENKEADKLATKNIKSNRTQMVASLFDNNGEESPSSKG